MISFKRFYAESKSNNIQTFYIPSDSSRNYSLTLQTGRKIALPHSGEWPPMKAVDCLTDVTVLKRYHFWDEMDDAERKTISIIRRELISDSQGLERSMPEYQEISAWWRNSVEHYPESPDEVLEPYLTPRGQDLLSKMHKTWGDYETGVHSYVSQNVSAREIDEQLDAALKAFLKNADISRKIEMLIYLDGKRSVPRVSFLFYIPEYPGFQPGTQRDTNRKNPVRYKEFSLQLRLGTAVMAWGAMLYHRRLNDSTRFAPAWAIEVLTDVGRIPRWDNLVRAETKEMITKLRRDLISDPEGLLRVMDRYIEVAIEKREGGNGEPESIVAPYMTASGRGLLSRMHKAWDAGKSAYHSHVISKNNNIDAALSASLRNFLTTDNSNAKSDLIGKIESLSDTGDGYDEL